MLYRGSHTQSSHKREIGNHAQQTRGGLMKYYVLSINDEYDFGVVF